MSAPRSAACSQCRHEYSGAAWAALPVVQTLTGRELGAYVSAWQEAHVIEVRACAVCGGTMARTTTRAA